MTLFEKLYKAKVSADTYHQFYARVKYNVLTYDESQIKNRISKSPVSHLKSNFLIRSF